MKDEMVVARIKILMEHHRSRLKKIIEQSSATVWKVWSAQAAKFQTLRTDYENQQKPARDFTRWTRRTLL